MEMLETLTPKKISELISAHLNPVEREEVQRAAISNPDQFSLMLSVSTQRHYENGRAVAMDMLRVARDVIRSGKA